MKMRRLLFLAVMVAALLPLAAWAADGEARAAAAPDARATGGEGTPKTPDSTAAAPHAPTLDLQAALGLPPEPAPQSCQTVCGSFHGEESECTDVGCYAIGCGYPVGYDRASCTCYCSFCF